MSANEKNIIIDRKYVTIVLRGIPKKQISRARKIFFSSLEQLEDMLSVPASKVHAQLKKEIPDLGTPAAALRGYRSREGLTQAELSRKTGIPQGHISDMEHGKRGIGIKSAKTLAKVLNCRWERLV